MKILFVTYYFPPLNSIASFRVKSFADELTKLGHDILVLAPDWSKEKSNPVYAFNTIHTHKADDSIYTDSGKSFKDFIRRKILYKIFAYNNFRDRKPGKFFLAAKSKIDQMDLSGYDYVITSFGPLDSIWIGKYIKEKYPSLKWIIDYRDYYSLFYKNFGIFKPHFRAWERKLVNTCDGFITVSETLKTNIQKLISKPGFVIYNGFLKFDVEANNEFENLINGFRPYLSYAGALYHGQRDIEPFIKFYAKNLVQKYDLVLALTDPLDVEYANGIIRKFELRNVKILVNISHNESLLLTKNAEYPILFNHYDKRSNGFLTGKIFEYVYFRKKVIYSGLTQSNELYQMFLKYGWGESFEKFNYSDTDLIDVKNIQSFSREIQAKHLEEFLLNFSKA